MLEGSSQARKGKIKAKDDLSEINIQPCQSARTFASQPTSSIFWLAFQLQ